MSEGAPVQSSQAIADHNYDGLKVLDFTRVLVGPYLTQIMRDMGAEVVKVEKPFSGTDERQFTPIAEGLHGTQSGYFMMVNRGKKSVALDLKDPDCVEAIYELIKWADVIVENFAPGVIDKLGFGYEKAKELNPRLIYCSISVFGQKGPYSTLPGYDIIAQAMSGLMWLAGDPEGPPMRCGTSIGDVNCTGYALAAIGAALYYREKTGKGQYIDMSMRDCLSAELETGLIRYLVSGGKDDPMRSGNHHATLGPYGVFNASGGRSCIIVAMTPNQWKALCELMGEEEWGAQEKFKDSPGRGSNREEITEHIERWLQKFDDYMDAIHMMQNSRIPCAPILKISELVQDPQWKMRNTLVHVNDPVFGEVDLPATPMVFSETSVYNDAPPPMLGEHTTDVLRNIVHMPEEKIRQINSKYGGN